MKHDVILKIHASAVVELVCFILYNGRVGIVDSAMTRDDKLKNSLKVKMPSYLRVEAQHML